MSTKFWIGAGLLATVTSLAPLALGGEQRMEKKVVVLNGPAIHEGISDKVTINDVDSLAIGETRTYTSPSGKEFELTRDAEERWTLRGEGKEFAFGGDPEDIEAGEGQVTINKRIVIHDGEAEESAAQIHTVGGDAKQVQVFVEKGKDGEPEVQRILVNGQPADPNDENVKIIVKKMDGGAGQAHAVWIDKDGTSHEGLPAHGMMMIETEDIQGGGAPENTTMVEIVRESGDDEHKRVEKRVFLFVPDEH